MYLSPFPFYVLIPFSLSPFPFYPLFPFPFLATQAPTVCEAGKYFHTVNCVACHNPAVMFGGIALDELSAGAQAAARAWGGYPNGETRGGKDRYKNPLDHYSEGTGEG